jgi:hypothetical protein
MAENIFFIALRNELNSLKLPQERLNRHFHAGAWEREKRIAELNLVFANATTDVST